MTAHILQIGLVFVMLTCTTAQGCISGAIRTVTDNGRDFVQYCISGEWRLHCAGEGLWREQEADVACRQLGYKEAAGTEQLYETHPGAANTTNFFRFAAECVGNENSVQECGGDVQELNSCDTGEYGIAECLPADCTTGDIRLMGGSTEREGTIEMCMDRRWGTVCNNSQEGLAEAVCAKASFLPYRATFGSFAPSTPPSLSCTVQSDSLQCTTGSCDVSPSLGVVCRTQQEVAEILQNETLSCEAERSQVINESSLLSSTLQQCRLQLAASSQSRESATSALGAVIGLLVLLLIIAVTGWVVTYVKLSRSSVPRSKTTVRVHTNESYSLQQTVYDEAIPTETNYSSLGPNYDAFNHDQQQTTPTVQRRPAPPAPYGASKKDDKSYNFEDHVYAMVDKKETKKKAVKKKEKNPHKYETAMSGEP